MSRSKRAPRLTYGELIAISTALTLQADDYDARREQIRAPADHWYARRAAELRALAARVDEARYPLVGTDEASAYFDAQMQARAEVRA